MRSKAILAIVKKDIHGLLPLVVLASAVFIAQPVIANLDLEQGAEFWSVLQLAFYWLGYFVATLLMISVLQQDPAMSLDHDWLTRPISRVDWLIAKLLFLFLTVPVPIVSARILVNLGTGDEFGGLLSYATAVEIPPTLLATPILFTIALLTPTFKKSIFVLVVICLIFMVPAWDGGRLLLSRIGVEISNNFGTMMWVQAIPILALGVGSTLVVYWLLYCRRRRAEAWVAFGLSFALVFLCIFPPAAIYGWDEVIAIHKRLVNDPDDSLDDAVLLEHALACFPAASMGGDGNGANPVLVQASWDNPVFAQTDPDALTFATTIRSRDALRSWFSPSNTTRRVPVDWRIDRIRARGRYVADSLAGDIELRRSTSAVNEIAPMSAVDTDYWLIPGDAVAALAQDPSTRLILDYDLALLSPTPYELRTDGQRRDLPELGSCRAEIDGSANTIEIDCIKRGAQPAMVSAELVGLGSGRVDSHHRPQYAPDWLEAIGRKRYEMTLEYPSLVDSSVVILTAYKVERILHKRLETRGLLGGPRSTCPLPGDERVAAMEQSSWSDRSPHEVSSITVDRDVRVEVLDWRSGEPADRPALFLIPGLGATAHSYDDIAPKLAQKYDVVAMTRRGIGDSSRPDHGYEIQRLGQDVIEVLDTLGIESPILVGSSMGGDELSFLGANHPERFAGLIYLDAAYDRVTERGEPPEPNLSLPSRPPPRPSELVSYEALTKYYQRTMGIPPLIPEGEIMASYDLSFGAVVPKHDFLYLDAIEMGLEAPAYARIPLPALAIYAMPASPESLMESWYDRNDPVVQQAVKSGYEWVKAVKEEQISLFSEGVANSEVLILEDAHHWIFVSNEEDVLNAIEAFVETL